VVNVSGKGRVARTECPLWSVISTIGTPPAEPADRWHESARAAILYAREQRLRTSKGIRDE
jgi:hypothetical protein